MGIRKALSLLVVVVCCGISLRADASRGVAVHSALLSSSNQQPTDEFGNSVAIDGDTAVVGAVGASSGGSVTGLAYVFEKPASGWTDMTQTATLAPSDDAVHFGWSVAISGDTIVVGAPYSTVNGIEEQGALYVFVKPASGWADMTETAKLTGYHLDPVGIDYLGISVSISGNTIVAAAPGAKPIYPGLSNGEALVYVEPEQGWVNSTETAVLYNQFSVPGFASSVAVGAGTVIVGATGCCYQGEIQTGAGYVYVEPPPGWTTAANPNAQLAGTSVGASDDFGYSVAVDGNTIVIGSPQIDSYEVGAVYVFVKPTSGWKSMRQTAELYPLFTEQGDFGQSVAISESEIFIGAPFTTVQHAQQGAAYLFVEPGSGWRSTDNFRSKLTNAPAYYYFGQSVSISGTTAVVGFAGTSDTNGGADVYWWSAN